MQNSDDGIRRTVPSSAQAGATLVRGITKKYPWETIKVGESFPVYYNEMKLTSLRPYANRMAKKFGKRFQVINHGPEIGYEVACLLMEEKQAIETSSNVVEALGKIEVDFGFEKEKE